MHILSTFFNLLYIAFFCLSFSYMLSTEPTCETKSGPVPTNLATQQTNLEAQQTHLATQLSVIWV